MSLYFHAQYRQSAPCVPVTVERVRSSILDGKQNYVYCETRGRGHLMGVTLGVLQNANGWWGEGDEMIFVDDETKPAIIGTGSEDYFLGSWDFGGRDGAQPVRAHHVRRAADRQCRAHGRAAIAAIAGTATIR